MDIKYLEVTVMSAKGLQDINLIHRMDPYVVVTLSGLFKQRTDVDKNGGSSPSWGKLLAFPVDEARAGLLFLLFEIMTEKTLGEAKEVGKVRVPVEELLEKKGDGKPKLMRYNVKLSSGETQGILEFYYKFGEELPAGFEIPPAREADHQEPPKKSGGQRLISGLTGGLFCAGQVVDMLSNG